MLSIASITQHEHGVAHYNPPLEAQIDDSTNSDTLPRDRTWLARVRAATAASAARTGDRLQSCPAWHRIAQSARGPVRSQHLGGGRIGATRLRLWPLMHDAPLATAHSARHGQTLHHPSAFGPHRRYP